MNRKSKAKRITALIFAFLLAFATSLFIASTTLADDYSDLDYSQSVEITYTELGSYVVYIPQTISVGETAHIYADIDVPDNKVVTVMFDTFMADNTIPLTNENTDDTVSVYFTDGNGERFTNQYRRIGTFGNYNNGQTYDFTVNVVEHEKVKAGTYRGNMNFFISCIDAP